MNIKSASDLGNLIRKVRKSQHMTQPELAGATGTGTRFIVDLENGKSTCEIDKAITVALMLGIKITATAPES
jgi:HTH-type transcriptional regulator / antitoxin HipB